MAATTASKSGSGSASTTESNANEIHLVRQYDAPVSALWDAWTDPAQVAQWWGPRGFTITTHEKDLRVGGHWHYTMHGPDGVDYENTTLYHEVVPMKKLVYDHGGHQERPPLFRVAVLFSPSADGGSTLDMRMTPASPEAAEQMRAAIRKHDGNSTWDRLGEYLEHEESGRELFVINRTFEAPRSVVFEMWANPDHLAKWMPPVGATMQFLRADVRVGGSAFFWMGSSEDFSFHGSLEFLEIEPPTRLVYLQDFRDADGHISRHPLVPTWPERMRTTVLFVEEGPQRTRVTVTWEPQAGVKPAELAAFVDMRGSMTQGWTGSFDKLEALLEAPAT